MIEVSKEKRIREYVDNYSKYFPELWRWNLSQSPEQSELYMKTRARRTKTVYENADLLPDFYSIERDANQFGFDHVKWTDFFGLEWEGKKGNFAMVGAPNYRGSLYYYSDDDNDYDESRYHISEEFDAYSNQPPDKVYTKVAWRGINHWIDTVDACDINYKYIVDNHLFKDTHIDLKYKDGETVTVYGEYDALIKGLAKQGKKRLIEKVLKSMNEHFIKLRDSEDEEIRKFYPGKTAEEMFEI